MKIKRRKFLQVAVSLSTLGYLNNFKFQQKSGKEEGEIEKLIDLVKFKYEREFTEEQLKMLREEIQSNLRRRERLLSFQLSNWEEPDFKFQV